MPVTRLGVFSPFARRPLFSFRRLSWPYYLVSIAILFIIIRTFSSLLQRPDFSFPLDLQPPSGPNTLRPGDFVDGIRHRKLPDDEEEPALYEPDSVGTLHDVRNEKFYLGGTLSLTTQDGPEASHPVPVIYDPYPDYNSGRWRRLWKGHFEPCLGPRGNYLDRTRTEDMVSVYRGNQKDFPFPMFGSYEALNLDGNVCVDRYSRFGAYGYDEDNDTVIPGFQRPAKAHWHQVNWGMLQSQCVERNADRYKPSEIGRCISQHTLSFPPSEPTTPNFLPSASTSPSSSFGRYKSRSAVIIRSWHNMTWTPNHHQYLRSLVMELSLHSGAEYEVFLLVHVKDDTIPIYSDDNTVQRLKEIYIPAEFRNMTIFFNNKLLEAWYPKVEEHSPIYQHLQPVQIFSQLYPDFDYYWQFEMDARNTGHMYHFLEQAVEFAKQQPRKYLWERNAYYYTPGAHGSWAEFIQMVDKSMVDKESVWGPVPAEGINPVGPKPPVSTPREDNYEWGVGEEADLVTFLPIFDPRETTWTFPSMLWNLPDQIPRRASPVTMWRMSKKLLGVMHQAQATQGLGLVSEMSAPSFALLHGLKAVHVPHPLYVDGEWTAKELARIFNPGLPEKINGGPDSIWNWNHLFDHILYRISYMFTTQTAEDLFRRWLGYKPDPNQYTDGKLHQDPQGRFWYDGGSLQEDVYGRLCFPPMLLHTIKNTAEEKGPDMAVPV